MRNESATLRGSQREHLTVADSIQLRRVRGEEINRRLTARAADDSCVMKAGVRQEADHVSYRE